MESGPNAYDPHLLPIREIVASALLTEVHLSDNALPSGVANEKFSAEQRIMLAELEKSKGGNNASLGDDGELLVTGFLSRFLPPQFRAYKGHYRKINGDLSREIDVMIVDSRFPILNETKSGVVHVMQHALLCTVEVKRTLGKTQISTIRKDILALHKDKVQQPALSIENNLFWSPPTTVVLAFRSDSTLQTLVDHFYKRPIAWGDMFILEHDFECRGTDRGIGALIRIEGTKSDYECMTCRIENPLSDFYYMLIEQSFDVLSTRGLPDGAMRDVISSYYNWSTLRKSFTTRKDPIPVSVAKGRTTAAKIKPKQPAAAGKRGPHAPKA